MREGVKGGRCPETVAETTCARADGPQQHSSSTTRSSASMLSGLRCAGSAVARRCAARVSASPALIPGQSLGNVPRRGAVWGGPLPGVEMQQGAAAGALTLVGQDVAEFEILVGKGHGTRVVGRRGKKILELEAICESLIAERERRRAG